MVGFHRRQFLLACAAFAVCAPATAATNLVLNGRFESGLTNWALTGGNTGDFPPVAINYNSATPYPSGAFAEAVTPDNPVSPSPDAVGNRAAYFVSDFANPHVLSQTINVGPGRYIFGLSTYAPKNGLKNKGDATFTASFAGVQAANFMVSSQPSQTWKLYSAPVTIAVGGPQTITLSFSTNFKPSKDIVVDRVHVMAVREPQSWATMILGFGMVAGALRRRHAALQA